MGLLQTQYKSVSGSAQALKQIPTEFSRDCIASIQQFLSSTYCVQDIALGTREQCGIRWGTGPQESPVGEVAQ